MARILVVDDNEVVCETLCACVAQMGHDAVHALSLEDGKKQLDLSRFDVVFLDVRFPEGNGLLMLPEIRKTHPELEVIIMTGEADENDAELAIKSGAWDYVKKPLSLSDIGLQLRQVFQYRTERAARKTAVSLKRDNLIGESPQMRACLDLLVQAASSDVNVLVTGETGTGKELFCRAIHDNSSRSDKVFVVVDCAALPETLLESVLFGHVKGAFTGADKARPGLIKQANGGTLFLDEIGELPLSMQKAFLRVLQEHHFRPVGGSQEEASDFRLLAATNRDLSDMVEQGQFRRDLLFRVQSHRINLPPLRERKDDIRPIVVHHIQRLCTRRNIPPKRVSDDFVEALEAHTWPGNVRELVSVVEAAATATEDEHTLFARHLPMELRVARTRKTIHNISSTPDRAAPGTRMKTSLPCFQDFRRAAVDQAEKQYMEDLLAASEGGVETACELSGLSRSRVYQLMQKHHLSLPR
jgi:two-component system, NtrC family, response regulator